MGHVSSSNDSIKPGCNLLLLSVLSLAGCTTSPVALEQANHTVRLMSLMDEQLSEFRRLQGAAEQARLQSLVRQKNKVQLVEETASLDTQAAKSAGDTTREPFAKKMLADADGLAEVKARSVGQQAAYATKLGALLTPLPSTTASVAQAQTKAALMGRELDSAVRFNEIQLFVTELAESVKANSKKIDEAKAAAAKADNADKATTAADAAASAPKL
jgi:membrane protein involved in colicin uptake